MMDVLMKTCHRCTREIEAELGWLVPSGHGYEFLCSPCRWGK